jgi:2-polyprenyl-3-methyl-5-hydroxy-6-metoxy-1,4-benzoquinol methylase
MGDPNASEYNDYFTTHISKRKGMPTREDFEARARQHSVVYGKFLPKDRNCSIIDVGCGTGHFIYWLKKRGYTRVEGIDISQDQVQQAHRMGLTKVRCTSLETHFTEPGHSYDLVIMRDVLEHVPPEKIMSTLRSIGESMKPGGELLIQVPNAENPFFGYYRYGDLTHQTAFTRTSMDQLLARCGFGSIRFLNSVHLVHRFFRFLLSITLWKLMRIHVPSRSLVFDASLNCVCRKE